MNERILLKKTCSIYASDLHLATMIFPYISKEIKENATIKTILENGIGRNIEKIINHTNLNSEIEEKIKQIDWSQTNINKIKNILREIEKDLKEKEKVDIFISGTNIFIDKVNQVIDLWVKNNLDEMKKNQKMINIINCYQFEQNEEWESIMRQHEYRLNTTGIEEIYDEETLKKAN